MSLLPRGGPVYYYGYLTASLIDWITAALAVREMFALTFTDYPGLRTAGRWAFYAALAISLAVSVVIVMLVPHVVLPRNPLLYYQLIFDRSIDVALAVTIAVLMRFLSGYPLKLDRNTYVCSGFFSAVFLAGAAVKMLDSLSHHLAIPYIDNIEVGFTAACLVGWGAMLKASSAISPPRATTGKAREIELLQRLESMNETLSRSLRQ